MVPEAGQHFIGKPFVCTLYDSGGRPKVCGVKLQSDLVKPHLKCHLKSRGPAGPTTANSRGHATHHVCRLIRLSCKLAEALVAMLRTALQAHEVARCVEGLEGGKLSASVLAQSQLKKLSLVLAQL